MDTPSIANLLEYIIKNCPNATKDELLNLSTQTLKEIAYAIEHD